MGFPYMDPIAGGLVGLMIAHTGGEMVWQSVADLTDTVNADEIRELERIINRWACPSKHALTVHGSSEESVPCSCLALEHYEFMIDRFLIDPVVAMSAVLVVLLRVPTSGFARWGHTAWSTHKLPSERIYLYLRLRRSAFCA